MFSVATKQWISTSRQDSREVHMLTLSCPAWVWIPTQLKTVIPVLMVLWLVSRNFLLNKWVAKYQLGYMLIKSIFRNYGCQHDCTPPHLTARQKASRHRLWLLLFAAKPAIGWLFLQGLSRMESAPAVFACSALFSRLFVCLLASAFAMPTALLISSAPFKFALPPFNVHFVLLQFHFKFCFVSPVHCHVRQDRLVQTNKFASC